MKHPWWHWFFTHTIEWGTKSVNCAGGSVWDISVEYCSRCKKFHREEKLREYV